MCNRRHKLVPVYIYDDVYCRWMHVHLRSNKESIRTISKLNNNKKQLSYRCSTCSRMGRANLSRKMNPEGNWRLPHAFICIHTTRRKVEQVCTVTYNNRAVKFIRVERNFIHKHNIIVALLLNYDGVTLLKYNICKVTTVVKYTIF